MNSPYVGLPLKEVFRLKQVNADRITALKNMVADLYQRMSRVSVDELSSVNWLRFQHVMDVARKIRAILENDREMLYSALHIQDARFSEIDALVATLKMK